MPSHLMSPALQDQVNSLAEKVHVLESEKIRNLNNEIIYLKGVVEFQNSRIDKLTNFISDVLKSDNSNLLSLSALQDNDVGVDTLNAMQGPNNTVSVPPTSRVIRRTEVEQENDLQDLQANIHPDINNENGKKRHDDDKPAKRPKVMIDFIHNPMTVKEIHDEFTKGFKGQPPLAELDQRFGKANWRGDSRSKESKRFQRRKRLCDAIKRGMVKYNKTADEIINYIEEFRGDKSLTWVMNGNLPEDLLL